MKKLVVIAVLVSLMAGAIYAQAVPGDFQSPTNYSSFGRYRSAADDFIRPDSYTSAKVENWFAMTSFANNYATGTVNNYVVNIGYANQMKGLYLGVYYGGAFWQNVNNRTYTESHIAWHGVDKDGVKTYTAGFPPMTAATGNRISILLGLADMGFRISFYSNLNTFHDNDFIEGGTEYKSYQAANGTLSPQLAWSMAKNLTDNGIKPWLTADLDFNQNYSRYTEYDGAPDYKAGDEYVGNSQNNTYTRIEAGLGGYTFLKKNGFSYSADLDYRGRFYGYNNEYNYQDGSGKNKIGAYKGTYTGTGGGFAELKGSNHRIRPSVAGSWSGENLGVKFKLNLPLEISSTGNKPMAIETGNTSGKLVQGGSETSTSTIGFPPSLQIAAQWKIVPKLTLNAGGEIALSALSRTKTEVGKDYNNGVVDNTTYSSTEIRTSHGGTTNALRLGVALLPTNNLTFEAACGVDTGNSVNVFDTGNGGLFHFANILVSVKF